MSRLNCEFLSLGCCLVAERLLREAIGESRECPTTDDACRACRSSPEPLDLNRATASLAVLAANETGQAAQVAAQYRDVLLVESVKPQPCPPVGPGTELHNLLALVGIRYEPGCACEQHACEMNRRGPEWCERNIERIVGQMKHEARRRGWPFFRPAARRIVQLAIWRARRADGVSEVREITDGRDQQAGD